MPVDSIKKRTKRKEKIIGYIPQDTHEPFENYDAASYIYVEAFDKDPFEYTLATNLPYKYYFEIPSTIIEEVEVQEGESTEDELIPEPEEVTYNLSFEHIGEESKEEKSFREIRESAFFFEMTEWFQLKFAELLYQISGGLISEIYISKNDIEIKTTPKNIEALIWLLKYSSLFQYNQLSELTAVDVINYTYRFKIVYVLLSLKYGSRVIISVKTDELINIFSISYLYKSAGWLEREVWDLFGVKFYGNSEPGRILTDYGFKGHPLRKEFPLTGFFETYFDDSSKRILYEPVGLAQDYRIFDFSSPWNIHKFEH